MPQKSACWKGKCQSQVDPVDGVLCKRKLRRLATADMTSSKRTAARLVVLPSRHATVQTPNLSDGDATSGTVAEASRGSLKWHLSPPCSVYRHAREDSDEIQVAASRGQFISVCDYDCTLMSALITARFGTRKKQKLLDVAFLLVLKSKCFCLPLFPWFTPGVTLSVRMFY